MGLNNIIYPEFNINKKYLTTVNDENYYLTQYYDSLEVVPEKKAVDLFEELTNSLLFLLIVFLNLNIFTPII